MMAVVLIPIVMAVMVWMENWIFARWWDRKLSVEIAYANDRASVGDEILLTERVKNGKWMPILVLQVGYQTDIGLEIHADSLVTISDHVNVLEVFSLGAYERTERHLHVTCIKRGYYRIRNTSLKGYHLFGLDAYYKNIEQIAALYVYPQRVNLPSLFMVIDRLSGDLKAQRFLFEDPFLFRGIREYTPLDPMSQINWKASARTGSLQVNLRDYTAGQRVWILLNLENPICMLADDLLEDSIRIAATIAERLIQHQIPVCLSTNGIDVVTGTIPTLGAGCSQGHLQRILETLARLDIHIPVTSFSAIVAERVESTGDVQESCCVISVSQSDAVATEVEQLGIVQGSVLWICPLLRQTDSRSVDSHIEFVRVNHEDLL